MEVMRRRIERRGVVAPYSWHRDQPSAGGRLPGNICKFWLSGNCTRNPCRFLHPDKASPMSRPMPLNNLKFNKQSHDLKKPLRDISERVREENNLPKKQRSHPEIAVAKRVNAILQSIPPVKSNGDAQMTSVERNDGGNQKPAVKLSEGGSKKVQLKICQNWIKDSCTYGEKCKYMHSWSSGDWFSRVSQLEGHTKAVTGIHLPVGFDKLFTASEDGTIRFWNCHTGECIAPADMGVPVGCLISEGPWVFAGITKAVKAWNLKTETEFTLDLPAGRVYALAASDGMVFAGHQDGSVYVWKLNPDETMFEAMTVLKGHSQAVVSLVYGANKLYSGAMDNTIRQWDLKTMLCTNTLKKHSEVVMSMVCWDQYLLSCSLDNTLKVWAATESGGLEDTVTHKEEHGILSVCGMYDASGKPILLCSCNDNSVRLYELPTFIERGRIYAKEEVRSMHAGPHGLFFTGDGSGVVSVWKCTGEMTASLNTS